MTCTLVKFATVPTQYAPKRKFLEVAKPQWHNKLGEFSDPDILAWVNTIYQAKVFPSPCEFNAAYDARETDRLYWRNKTMVLTKEDLNNFEEEFNEGAFDESKEAVQKAFAKMKAALGTGEKVLFVY